MLHKPDMARAFIYFSEMRIDSFHCLLCDSNIVFGKGFYKCVFFWRLPSRRDFQHTDPSLL